MAPRRRYVALLWVALMTSLLLGTAFVVVSEWRSAGFRAFEHPDHPLSDEQAKAQVAAPAEEIVAIGDLRGATAGYTLISCTNLHDPPYQGSVYMNFRLPPHADPGEFYQNIANVMVGHGWAQGLTANQHLYGQTFAKNGVTAIVYGDDKSSDRGIVQLYGECRNVGDHRGDTGAWTDITDQLRSSP